ncbi:MAG: endonuclease/exonuclease/phosphatase family protein [Rikenellaceae bacterium]
MKILRTLLLLALAITFGSCSKKEPQKITVMQLNIWQEGTVIENGYQAIVDELAHHQPDFVTLSEVRNYGDVDFTNRLIEDLKAQGVTYYSQRSDDSGLLSKYPIESFETIYPLANDSGSIYKLTTTVSGVAFAIYTAHLDYKEYASFLPRGYDGSSFHKIEAPVVDTAIIQKMNLASKRDDAILAFISDAQKERERGAVVILGGDFNEPSFRDWGLDTRDLYDHNGVSFDWTVSILLEQNGFIDSYRRLYPSAVTHPGFTYPSDNRSLGDDKMGMLTWAPDVDERERIDYIFFGSDSRLELLDCVIYGPRESIVRSQRIKEGEQERFIAPLGVWPTDHKGVISYFHLHI